MWSSTNANDKLSEGGDFEEIKIRMPFGHIAGKWWGPRHKQPIIAVHGLEDNAGTFDTLAPFLAKMGIALLCIDLPGHGYSSHYQQGLGYDVVWDGLKILRRIIKYFRLDNVTILGHSLGGSIGFLYAVLYPNNVEKCIFLDVAGLIFEDPTSVIQQAGDKLDQFLFSDHEQKLDYTYDEAVSTALEKYQGAVTKESCKILLKRAIKPLGNGKNTYNFCNDQRLKTVLNFFTQEFVLEFVARIKCEVLIILVKGNKTVCKMDHYNTVIEKLRVFAKHVEYRTVEGTHYVHLNNPERVANIIIDFFKEV